MKHDRSYSCIVMLVYIRNLDKGSCSSVKQLIAVSDKLGEKLGYNVKISYDTKLAIINDMVDRGILEKEKRGLTQPISLKPKIQEFILESLTKV